MDILHMNWQLVKQQKEKNRLASIKRQRASVKSRDVHVMPITETQGSRGLASISPINGATDYFEAGQENANFSC